MKELDGLVPRFDDEEEERSISDVKDLHRTMCDKIPKVIGALLSSNALPDDVVSENVMELIDAYLRVASCCLYARQLYSTIQWNCMLECLEKIPIRIKCFISITTVCRYFPPMIWITASPRHV